MKKTITRAEAQTAKAAPKFIKQFRDKIRCGTKTQTRRPIKPQPVHAQVYEFGGKKLHDNECRHWCWKENVQEDNWQELPEFIIQFAPFAVGQILYMREPESIADPPAFLSISRVWVERLGLISTADVYAEGFSQVECAEQGNIGWDAHGDCEGALIDLWNSFYASKGLGWDDNPWVWCYEFEVVEVAK